MDAYNRAAAPVVAGGQHRAAQLAVAYIATQAQPRSTPALGVALRDLIVTRASPVTRSPILRLWSLIDDGHAVAEAQGAAGSYAEALASNDLQVAERAGLNEGARVAGERVVGWRKALDPGCCAWCQRLAVGTYRSAESVPFHERDRCSVAPILKGE